MTVDPLFGNDKHIVVEAGTPKGPREGDVLCLTPIPFPADGARVNAVIDGVKTDEQMADQKRPEKKAAMLIPEAKPLP